MAAITRVDFKVGSLGPLLSDRKMREETERRAERIAEAARASAPVDTGEYRDSIHVETALEDGRWVSRVLADSGHSLVVEARTGNLNRALDAGK
jgi:hypothetical protein